MLHARTCLSHAILAVALSLALPASAASLRPGKLKPAATATTATTATGVLETGLRLPGYPHAIDVYRPAGATRVVVFLHGHGGTNWQMAFNLGINRKPRAAVAANVDWALLQRHDIIAVFPQAQALDAASSATWSNRIFDSGQDDVAFLTTLAAHARTAWGARQVALAGHSAGGTMAGRLWCEQTEAFDAYYSVAGPMPAPSDSHFNYNCSPTAAAPYAMVVGDQDRLLPMFSADRVQPTPQQVAAGLLNSTLTAEWLRHGHRGAATCGELTALADATARPYGPVWQACDGGVQFTVVRGADHPMSSIQARTGEPLLDWIVRFSLDGPAALGR